MLNIFTSDSVYNALLLHEMCLYMQKKELTLIN